MMKKELSCGTIEILNSDLVYIVYRDEYKVELEDVQEVDQAFLEIAEEETLYVIMDTRSKYNIFSKEAQTYLSKQTATVERGLLGGFAIIINSLPYRILLRFYLHFYKPNYNLKAFSNQKDAQQWLDQLKEEKEAITELQASQ